MTAVEPRLHVWLDLAAGRGLLSQKLCQSASLRRGAELNTLALHYTPESRPPHRAALADRQLTAGWHLADTVQSSFRFPSGLT